MEYNLTNGSMSGVSSPYDIVTTATSDDCGQLCDVLRAKLGKDCYSYEWMPQCKTSVDKFDGSLGGKKFALSPGYLILQSFMKKVEKGALRVLRPFGSRISKELFSQ